LCVGHLDAVVAVVAAGRKSVSTSEEIGQMKKEGKKGKAPSQDAHTKNKNMHKKNTQNRHTETHKTQTQKHTNVSVYVFSLG